MWPRDFAPVRISLIVVSDRVFLDPSSDKVANLVRSVACHAGYRVEVRYVPNEKTLIQLAVLESSLRADLVVVAGGTGPGPRDLSVEAVRPLFEKELEGFGERFRLLSSEEVGARALLSRATAGVVGRSLVFVVPGRPEAVRLALEHLILPAARDALEVVRGGSHWRGPELTVREHISVRDAEIFAKRHLTSPASYSLVAVYRAGSVGWTLSGNTHALQGLLASLERAHSVRAAVVIARQAPPGGLAVLVAIEGERGESCLRAVEEVFKALGVG